MPNASTIKNIILGAVAIVAAFVYGFLFASFVNFPNLTSLIYVFISGILFLAAFLIQTLLSNNFWVNAGLIVLQIVAFSIFFLFGHFSVILLIGITVALTLLLVAYKTGQEEIKNNLELRFIKISRLTIGLAGAALALFSTFAYFSLFDFNDPVSARETLEIIVKPAEPIAASYIPNFSVTDSLSRVALNLLPPELQLAPPEVRDEFIRESSARLAEIFGNMAGVAVAPGDSVLDIVYKATVGRLLLLQPYLQTLVLIAAAVFFFFVIKFVLLFVDWLAILLGFIAYKILQSVGFFKIELQSKSKKVIVI